MQARADCRSRGWKSEPLTSVLCFDFSFSPLRHLRLLEENRASKQIVQLFQLAELAGDQIEFSLKKKKAA
jgi:hypothetical protein